MLKELAQEHTSVRATFEEASDVLELDLWSLSQQGPEEELSRTEITQPLMLSAAISAWRVWRENGGDLPAQAAGHSLGEYSALVSAGVFAFRDAIAVVSARGRFMQEAVPAGRGAMAAILGLDTDALDKVCDAATQGTEIVSCANFNAPGQTVIAGDAGAVDRAVSAARDAGAKRAIPLAVSAPFHCDLMQPAAERLLGVLDQCDFSPPEFPVVHNVDVRSASDPGEIKRALYRQVALPVQWIQTIERFATGNGTVPTTAPVTLIVEFGPGKVLTGMCKRIDRALTCCGVYDPASLGHALEVAQNTA